MSQPSTQLNSEQVSHTMHSFRQYTTSQIILYLCVHRRMNLCWQQINISLDSRRQTAVQVRDLALHLQSQQQRLAKKSIRSTLPLPYWFFGCLHRGCGRVDQIDIVGLLYVFTAEASAVLPALETAQRCNGKQSLFFSDGQYTFKEDFENTK